MDIANKIFPGRALAGMQKMGVRIKQGQAWTGVAVPADSQTSVLNERTQG